MSDGARLRQKIGGNDADWLSERCGRSLKG